MVEPGGQRRAELSAREVSHVRVATAPVHPQRPGLDTGCPARRCPLVSAGRLRAREHWTVLLPGLHLPTGSGLQLQRELEHAAIVRGASASGLGAGPNPGEDYQNVGWKFRIKAKSGRHVRTVYTSPFQISLATDQNPAALTDVTVSPTITSFAHHFVVIKLYWFGPDGWPHGWAQHRIRNNVRRNAGDPNGVIARFCDTGYA